MYNLTPAQWEAVNCCGKVVLKSCPGSGKTFVVASKFLNLIHDWDKKNKGISLLSFTNAAYDEVLRQIEKISGIKSIGYPHFIGTIDSFIFQWLYAPFGHLIMRCSRRPSILLETSKILHNTHWRHECYIKGCDPLDFYFDIDGNLKNSNKDITNCQIQNNKPCYEFARNCFSNGMANYSGITAIVYRILTMFPHIGQSLAKRFPVFIIDEAQDTSQLQMRILDKLVEYGLNDITLIGDPDQAIYEFREADPTVFINKYIHSDWQKKDLNENFRCSQLICNATKVFSTLSEASKAIGESKDFHIKPMVWKYANKENLIKQFLQTCAQYEIPISPEKVAVLVRGKVGLFGHDYGRISGLWKTRIGRLLSEATYERDYGTIIKASNMVDEALYELFINQHCIMEPESLNEIERLINIETWKKLKLIFLKSLPNAETPLFEWKTNLQRLIEEFSISYGLPILPIDYLKIKSGDKYCPDFLTKPIKCFYSKAQDLSFLNSTIHAVKGRTFDAILLIISTNGELTTNILNQRPIESEAIRTAYVAMTRARKILIVAIPSTIRKETLTRFSVEQWDIDDEVK